MGCNCGKKRVSLNIENIDLAKKGGFGTKIKKIWKATEDTKIVVKKVDNK